MPFRPRDKTLPLLLSEEAFGDFSYFAINWASEAVASYLTGGFTPETLPREFVEVHHMHIVQTHMVNEGLRSFHRNIPNADRVLLDAIAGYRLVGLHEEAVALETARELLDGLPSGDDGYPDVTPAMARLDAVLAPLDRRLGPDVVETLADGLPEGDALRKAYASGGYGTDDSYNLRTYAFLARWDRVTRVAPQDLDAALQALLDDCPFTNSKRRKVEWTHFQQWRPNAAGLAALIGRHAVGGAPLPANQQAVSGPLDYSTLSKFRRRIKVPHVVDNGDHFWVVDTDELRREAERPEWKKRVGLHKAKGVKVSKQLVQDIADRLERARFWEAVFLARERLEEISLTPELAFERRPAPTGDLRFAMVGQRPAPGPQAKIALHLTSDALAVHVDNDHHETIEVSEALALWSAMNG